MLKTIFADGTYYVKGSYIQATLPEMLDELRELSHLIRLSSSSVDKGSEDMIDCMETFMRRYRTVQKAITDGKYKETNPYAID